MIKIIAVDDIVENLMVIEETLSSYVPEAEIQTFQSPVKAWEAILNDPPDVIILDVSMPEMDGGTLCKKIKAEPSTTLIPVIMMSGTYAEKKCRVRALNMGADGYLAKPLEEGELVAQVRAMLRIKAVEDSLRDKNRQLESVIAEKNALLQQQETQLQKFASRTRMAIWSYKADEPISMQQPLDRLLEEAANLRCAVCNTAYARMVGRSEKEIIGARFCDVHSMDDEVKEVLTRVIQNQYITENEFIYQRTINGAERFFSLSYVLTINNGMFVEIWGSQSEITQSVMLKTALDNSEMQYRSTINALDDMVFVIDNEYTILLANDQMQKTLAHYHLTDNPVGMKLSECVPSTKKEVFDEYQRVFTEGIIVYSQEVESYDGRDIYTETRKIPIITDGRVEKVLTVVRNITEQTRDKLIQNIIYDIAKAANYHDDLDGLFDSIRDSLRCAMEIEHFYAVLYDKESDEIRLQFDCSDTDYVRMPAGKSLTAYVLHTGTSLLATEEKQKQMCEQGLIELSDRPVRSWLGVPLKVNDEVIGALILKDLFKSNTYSTKDLEILEYVANEIALAIDRKRAHQHINKLLRKQIAVNRIARLLSRFNDAEAMLDEVYRHITQFLNVTSFSVSMYNQDNSSLRVIYMSVLGNSVSLDDLQMIPLGEGPQSRVIRTGKPINVKDYEAEVLNNVSFIRWKTENGKTLNTIDGSNDNPQSAAFVPLLKENKPIGVMQVQSIQKKAYTDDDIAFLSQIGTIVAIALDNARLFDSLKREVDERRVAQTRLLQSLDEKDVMLREIHHRVKNNLQIIMSIIKMQRSHECSDETKTALGECLSRVTSISMVHERLYGSNNYQKVDLEGYFHGLKRQIFNLHKEVMTRVEIETHLSEAYFDMNQAIPLGLILQELLTNAAKHGFPDGRKGSICVHLSTIDTMHQLEFRDSGVGLPQGFNFKQSNSLGMQLISALVDQLHGTISIESKRGTTFFVRFPEKK
jgi:PAS domain S-box-containing protein